MEDQVVSFETAKLAKEKGYEGLIGLGYRHNTGNYYNSKGELNGDCTDYIREIVKARKSDIKPISPNISAPTQSLLQKWLREKHNMEVVIKPMGNYSPNMKSYTTAVMSFSYGKHTTDTTVIFRGHENRGFIYEEVLEKGLQEALKLIP